MRINFGIILTHMELRVKSIISNNSVSWDSGVLAELRYVGHQFRSGQSGAASGGGLDATRVSS